MSISTIIHNYNISLSIYNTNVIQDYVTHIICFQLCNIHKSQNINHVKLKDFKLQFNREASALFFYFEQFNMDSAYLISNAHLKLTNMAELFSISDANTQLKIKKALHSIPSSISEEMTSIFKDILDWYCSNSKCENHLGCSVSF